MRRAGLGPPRTSVTPEHIDRGRPFSLSDTHCRHVLVFVFSFQGRKEKAVVATVEQLAALVRGRLVGDGTLAIRSARTVAEAGPGDITFIESERFAKLLKASPASAAIVGPHFNLGRQDAEPELDRDRSRRPDGGFPGRPHPLERRCRTRWTGSSSPGLGRPDRPDRSRRGDLPVRLRRRRGGRSAMAPRFTRVPSSEIAAAWARTASSIPTPCSTPT